MTEDKSEVSAKEGVFLISSCAKLFFWGVGLFKGNRDKKKKEKRKKRRERDRVSRLP
jgi:hypothetical protein